MGSRDFKIRMPVKLEEANSANVAAWLEEALADNSKRLAADPGAGDELLSLHLDREKVVELANRKRERVPVLLRRLIASHTTIPEAPEKEKSAGAVAAELIPDKVLPAKLRYDETDFIDLVHGMDSGLAMIYRRIYGVKDIEAQKTPEEDRKLAAAIAECANRRAPAWLLSNADLFKLLTSSVRWSIAQTEALELAADAAKKLRKAAGEPLTVAGPPATAQPSPAPAAATPRRANGPEPRSPVSEAEMDALREPVQKEGEF
jgi:hypothetical protein